MYRVQVKRIIAVSHNVGNHMIHLVTFAKNISQDFVIELILPFILVQEK